MNAKFASARLVMLLGALCVWSGVAAQALPNKPIRVIVGYGAGGLRDLTQWIVAKVVSTMNPKSRSTRKQRA